MNNNRRRPNLRVAAASVCRGVYESTVAVALNLFGARQGRDSATCTAREQALADYPRRLNDIVAAKTRQAAAHTAHGTWLPPEMAIVQARIATTGRSDVYKHRNELLVYGFMGLGAFLILTRSPSFVSMAAVGLIMMLWYDFYAGVLHIVLDHPGHLWCPGLADPCLEFQWHHHIPHDIADKSWIQACGDLTVAAVLLGVVNMLCMGLAWSQIGTCVMSWKLLHAYVGQYSHRVAHLAPQHKPAWAAWAQSVGLLMSSAAHRVHHSGNHDTNFCIGVGASNAALNWLLANVCGNRSVWAVLFVLLSCVDCWCITWVLTRPAFAGIIGAGADKDKMFTVMFDSQP